jgi:four helix bundle protein
MENKSIKNFTDLDAWQLAYNLVIKVYKISKDFPKEEIFGIVGQVRRAAVSVSANIAEGFGRYHYKDKVKFYYQARGSATEVQNLIMICNELNYINKEIFDELFKQLVEIQKLINGLIKSASNQP